MKPFLRANPATIPQLVKRGYFPSERAAQTRMLHLLRKGKVKRVGSVPAKNGTGRNRYVYSMRYWKQDHLVHEVNVTEYLNHVLGDAVRGFEVDRKKRPDFELMINGKLYYGEIDCCTESLNQVASRLKVYEPGDIVIFAIFGETKEESDERKRKIIRRVKEMGRHILFTTIQEVHEEPAGNIYETVKQSRVPLPVHRGAPEKPADLPPDLGS